MLYILKRGLFAQEGSKVIFVCKDPVMSPRLCLHLKDEDQNTREDSVSFTHVGVLTKTNKWRCPSGSSLSLSCLMTRKCRGYIWDYPNRINMFLSSEKFIGNFQSPSRVKWSDVKIPIESPKSSLSKDFHNLINRESRKNPTDWWLSSMCFGSYISFPRDTWVDMVLNNVIEWWTWKFLFFSKCILFWI